AWVNCEATCAKHAMMTPAAAPASNTAHGLDRPMSRATSEGSPNIPLPMMELTTRAARLHLPMARTSPDCPLAGKTWLYHSGQPSAISFQPLGNLDKKERQIGKMGDFDDRRVGFPEVWRPRSDARRYAASFSILMRSDFRNLRSWSLILNSGLVVRVVTREVLSSDFSPGLLTPMVASSTRKMSYPLSLILETTSAICSLSASDSLMASPSSFINCFNCWSTWPPEVERQYSVT